MPIGDDSVFSAIDDALWAALEDTASAGGANLNNWRLEQSPSGAHFGRNFRTGEIPDIGTGEPNIRDTDTPALIVTNGEALTVDDRGAARLYVGYQKEVIGLLRRSRDEGALDKKGKRFAELTWALLVFHARTTFGVADYVARDSRLVSIEFPNHVDGSGETGFTLGMTFETNLPI